MEAFKYVRATSAEQARASMVAGAKFVAGGTTLLDLMKLEVERPGRLVDINRVGLDRIEKLPDGRVRVGALVRNSDLAHAEMIAGEYAVLSEALLSGASAQLRNMATTGGNLLQRTRCGYFRSTAMACNKRAPGTGCAAIAGENRGLAILGGSEHCIATNASDMNVALTALEAVISIEGAQGRREVAMGDFYRLPGETPEKETVLAPGELITHVTLPKARAGARQVYLKLRDRASYEFALASAAVVLEVRGGKVEFVRVAMGGVGTKPWRSQEAEAALLGKSADVVVFRAAAEAALKDARPQSRNGFKVELAKRCVTQALTMAAKKA
jgi:xanthine dehydrogenase YagS FAD-binding subunit